MAVVEPAELHYADCPTTEAEVIVAAPPSAIWPVVCDISMPAKFSSEFQGGEWLDGVTEPALGARFRGRNFHPARGAWETVSTIYLFEPDHQLGWAVGSLDQPAASWLFCLEPVVAADGSGATRLRQWAQLGPGESGISELIAQMPDKESRILHRRLAEHNANMLATLTGIKELAEASV